MRKTKIETAETKQAILAAALQIFSGKGYDNTTLEEVAEVAGLTRGAVYWHFKNKEDLLHSLLDSYEESLLLQMQKLLNDPKLNKMNLNKRAKLWISKWIREIVKDKKLFRTRALYNIQYPERITEVRKNTNILLMRSVQQMFLPVLDEICHPDPLTALNFIIMVIDTSIAYKIILEDMKDHLLQGITATKLIREYHQLFVSYLLAPYRESGK